MPITHFQMTRSAELISLPFFREFIKKSCEGSGLDAQGLYDIQLAVDELCTNIITHGYAGMDPGSIILDVELTPGQAAITITDFGHAFEPVEPDAPDANASLEEREEGGLGLFFVFMSVDDVSYEASEAGNQTRLVKRFRNQ